MVSQILAEFLAEREAATATARKPFPLHALLALYQNSHPRDTYCEYMAGFRLLTEWLSPISIPQYSAEEILSVPKLCGSYEMNEIARILGTTPAVIYTCIQTPPQTRPQTH